MMSNNVKKEELKLKKVGIITLNGYVNYGNRLQNYALQEVLKSYGFDVQTIWVIIKRNRPEDFTLKQKIINVLGRTPSENLSSVKRKILGFLYKNKLDESRAQIFKEFSEEHINETPYKISENNIPENLESQFDYFITGSDQVWNPYFRKGDPTYFLTFAPKEKRIAYAPSFGTDEIPSEYISKYKKWISDMNKLSVREERGAKLIKDLTGRNAPVLVDPTLLLTKEQWLSISRIPSDKPKCQYLLTYFLGGIPRKRKKIINEIATENGLKIINLAQSYDRVPYLTGPSEFIDYINSASLFLTDSFHGAVFSILLETPFIVFDREGKFPSMNSRITTLLSTFNFENRHIDRVTKGVDILNMDFSHVDGILAKERRKSFNYLEEALQIKEGCNTNKRKS